MSKELTVPAGFGGVTNRYANNAAAQSDDLGAGISSSFGIVSVRGKVWRIKYQGNERPVMRADGDGPRASIDVVIVKGSQHLSKLFYEQGFVEGSSAPPDCFSSNGVTPDASSPKRQSPTCASCPQNAWGSKITPAGKKGKACSDSKRIAITPIEDMTNEAFGGPMLLRIPAASLRDMKEYNERVRGLGYPYHAVVTRLSFDTDEAYPKVVFAPVRPLTDAEIDVIEELQKSDHIARMLQEVEHAAVPSEAPAAGGFIEAPAAPAPVAPAPAAAVAAPVAAPAAPVAAAAPRAKPVEDPLLKEESSSSPIDGDLDDELAKLLAS